MNPTNTKTVEERQMGLQWQMGPYLHRKFLVPSEAAKALVCNVDHVYALIEEGKLHAQAPEDRDKKRYQIDARSVWLCIARRMLYRDEDFMGAVLGLCDRLQRPEAERVIRHLTQRLSRLS